MQMKKINLNDETFLTTNEISKLLRVTVSTVKKWRSKKIGPKPYKFGGCYRYCKFEILKMIADKKIFTHDDFIFINEGSDKSFFSKLKV